MSLKAILFKRIFQKDIFVFFFFKKKKNKKFRLLFSLIMNDIITFY